MTTTSYQSGFEIEHDFDDIDQHTVEIKQNKGQHSISTLLRIFGACAVIASLSLFLIEGWKDGNDLSRYIKLLAQTGLITGAGIFLSFAMKEVKGARVFFGLGLVSAVANFTILGALTYSIVQLDGALGDYPSMLKWEAVSLSTFLPLAIGAIVLLAMLTRFSYGIFARAEAGRLTMAFLALNALLLIPVREATYVSILAAIALLAATKITLNIVKTNALLLTLEAKSALACLFLPGLIIVGRALGLYAIDELLLFTLCSLAYYALRSIYLSQQFDSAKNAITWAQYFVGILAAGLLCSLIPSGYGEMAATVFSLTVLCFTFDQAKLTLKLSPTNNMQQARSIISLSSIVLILVNILYAFVDTSLLTTFCNLLMMLGTLLLIHVFAKTVPNLQSSQIQVLLGLSAIGVLLAFRTVSMFAVGSWVLFGGLGISLILFASIYERFGDTLKLPSREVKA